MKDCSELSKKEQSALFQKNERANDALTPRKGSAIVQSTQMHISALQKVLDIVDEPVYIVNLENHIILFANKKTEQLFGHVVGMRCWEKLQVGQRGVCNFCTNPLLLDENHQTTGAHKTLQKNELTNRWYQCNDQAFQWFDGLMVAIKTSVDVSELNKVTSRLDAALEEKKAMMEDLVLLVERERRKLSYDLHDEMGQIATAIKLNASFLANCNDTQSEQYLAATADIEQLASHLLSTVKGVSNNLNPRDLIGSLSVPDMLQNQFDEWLNRNKQMSSKASLDADTGLELPIGLKETLYRICQEALTNISKHAKANRVEISYRLHEKDVADLMPAGDEGIEYTHLIELEISDNGVGYIEAAQEDGLGLKYMAERVRLYGGLIHRGPCERMGGVRVLTRFPLY